MNSFSNSQKNTSLAGTKDYFGKNYAGLWLRTANYLKPQWIKTEIIYYSSNFCSLGGLSALKVLWLKSLH